MEISWTSPASSIASGVCSFASLHDPLLQHILSSECLTLQDRLHCEQVCKSWNACLLISAKSPALRETWPDTLRIIDLGHTSGKNLYLKQSDQSRKAEMWIPHGIVLCGKQSAAMHWLARRAFRFSSVTVVTQCMFTALHLDPVLWTLHSNTNSAGPEIHLETGEQSVAP